MDKYLSERDGQADFYRVFFPRVSPALDTDDFLAENNDGVLNGNLLTFKLCVTDLNAVLFQCIKTLSALRIKGKPVPANILIIDVNKAMVWLYRSALYLGEIEKLYSGGASKDSSGFTGGSAELVLHYDRPADAERLTDLLKERHFTKIHIDENCVVGWATSFYQTVPGARKEDFLGGDAGKHETAGEIRKPTVFEDYIYPYTGATNVKFHYLMDKLNDFLLKKTLGTFYTPPQYARKSLELVRMAIARVPAGNDYIILDRCAGTGNLESCLSDEELQHCIVSTVEYYEYKVLQELLGGRVRHLIPPAETAETFCEGLVAGADALSREYIESPVIRQYLDDPNCTVILFENPPYAETTSIEHQKKKAGKNSSKWKESYVMQEMRKDKSISGSAYNDLGNLFIWSAFHFYLRQDTDSYIVYSPVKYWKVQHLINKQFLGGYAFNRRHFHTNIDACIMCALWSNEDKELTSVTIRAFHIDKDGRLADQGDLPVKRVYSIYSSRFYDKRKFADDEDGGIIAEFSGIEASKDRPSVRLKPITNDNIIGYLVVKGANFDNPDSCIHLLRVGAYDANGFYLRADNYLEKLPMFAASRYISYRREWTERARIMKSADGADRFMRDVSNGTLQQFLLKCLLFTCMEMQNHMRSFMGSDGRFYRNELCLDGTNGETVALRDLKGLQINEKEQVLLRQWETVLQYAKGCHNYQSALTYGVYQIYTELDTSYKDEGTGAGIWDHAELHTALQGLKQLVKEYYISEIVPVLLEYEFIK